MRGLPGVDVDRILSALGIVVAEKSGSELVALCPGHLARTGAEDRHPSWSINTCSGLHSCWSCGFSGGLLGLVCEVRGYFLPWAVGDERPYNFGEAKLWLATLGQIDPEALTRHMVEAAEHLHNLPKPVPMSEARLAVFFDPPDWALTARRINSLSAKTYGVCWDEKRGNWITPIRDAISHKLLGWQEKGEDTRHFRNFPPGVAKGSTLFGIDGLRNWCGRMTLVVVESPLDAVRIHAAGLPTGHWAVATYGATVSKAQVALLQQADRVIVAMDNPRMDTAGRLASQQLLEAARSDGIDMRFFAYPDDIAKDPGELGDDQVLAGLEHSKHAVFGLRAFLP
jgi:hypothetical protein